MADAELRADYDRDGRLTLSQPEYDARLQGPGAVLVANADADRRTLPDSVSAGSPVKLDFDQATKSGRDDELLPLRIAVTNAAGLAGKQLIVRVGGAAAPRTRLYDDRGSAIAPPNAATPGDHLLAAVTNASLQLEARSVPGSPLDVPTTLNTTFTNDTVEEIAFQVTLLARDAAGVDVALDSGNFSLAPVLFLDNGARASRIYICSSAATLASVTDVRQAVRGISGVTLVTVPENVANGDSWLQDQFQPGIISAPDGWRHVIIHLPRTRTDVVGRGETQNLATFVRSHFPAHNVLMIDDFWQRSFSFADSSGATVTMTYLEAIALFNMMGQLFTLIDVLNDVGLTADPAFVMTQFLSWSDARAGLDTLRDDVVATLDRALPTAEPEWAGLLKEYERVIKAQVTAARTAFAQGSRPGTFTLPVGTRNVEVTSTVADQVYPRIEQAEGSGNYGGNIEATPPTADAPFGKIVIGNAVVDKIDHMDPQLRRFLGKQKQPVVEFDTTWLDVGHIDEVLTFVPDAAGKGATFAALRASSGLGMAILRGAIAQYRAGLSVNHPQNTDDFRPSAATSRLMDDGKSPVTRLHRGKTWLQHRPKSSGNAFPNVVDPPRIYQALSQTLNGGDPRNPASHGLNIHDIHYTLEASDDDRAYPADITAFELLYCETDKANNSSNDFIEAKKLAPIDKVLDANFKDIRRFPMPVLFDRIGDLDVWDKEPSLFRTSAFTPDLVNLQVVGGHLLVPRPYGPRMRPADAIAVLTEVLKQVPGGEAMAGGMTASFLKKAGLLTTTVWIERKDSSFVTVSDTSGLIRSVYDGLGTLDQVAQAFKDGFPGLKDGKIAKQIRDQNPRAFAPDDRLRPGWRLLTLTEGTVDLFEAYVALVADALRTPLHFVDSWFYHLRYGGIHCGTNVLREPVGKIAWWKS